MTGESFGNGLYWQVHSHMKIGAHVSIAGGYDKAVQKASAMGCNALQIFSASPRGWNFARPTDEDIDLFLKTREQHSIETVVFHASYLINLADTNRIGPLSRQLLTHELKLAARMNVIGSVIHLGSYKNNGNGHEELCSNIQAVLDKMPDDRYFIIENAGNRKIGQTIEQIAEIIKQLKDPRLKVCLDTCHLHAAGYDLRTKEAYDSFVDTFDTQIGLNRLAVWHINDSHDPFGSLNDHHENLGYGHVGIEVFDHIMHDPRMSDIPRILEVPGLDGAGPDKPNVDKLKAIAS